MAFLHEHGGPASRAEIAEALADDAAARRWSRLLSKLVRIGAIEAQGYGTGRRYWTLMR
jgi:hypothetical protein